MTDIYEEHIEQTFEESVDVYKPTPAIRSGEHDGEEFTIEVRERELPDGTSPSKATNINLIEWDEAFYLEWEDDGGAVNSYDIIVKNSSGDEVSSIEDREKRFVKYENLPDSFPQNGEEYSFEITSIFFTESIEADPITGEGSDKTPQNLTKTGDTPTSVSLSWDTVSGDVAHYKVYVTIKSSGKLKKTETSDNTDHTVEDLDPDVEYEFQVSAISLKGIFESDKSNTITFTPTYTPKNFTVTVADQPDDTKDAECSWDSVLGVDGYNIYLSDDGGSNYNKQNTSLITSTNYIIEDLSSDDYKAYVTAVIDETESDPSNIESFHTFDWTLKFDGTNDYVDLDDLGDSVSWNRFSIGCTFKTERTTTQCITGSFSDSTNTGFQILLNADSESLDVTNKVRLYLRDDDQDDISATIDSTYDFTDGEIHTLKISRTGDNEIKILIDDNEQTVTYSRQSNPDNFKDFDYILPLGIRNNRQNFDMHFKGLLDEVSFWNTGKSVSELKQDLSDIEGNESDLLAYYPIDEGEGGTIIDEAGDNDGTINGASWEGI